LRTKSNLSTIRYSPSVWRLYDRQIENKGINNNIECFDPVCRIDRRMIQKLLGWIGSDPCSNGVLRFTGCLKHICIRIHDVLLADQWWKYVINPGSEKRVLSLKIHLARKIAWYYECIAGIGL